MRSLPFVTLLFAIASQGCHLDLWDDRADACDSEGGGYHWVGDDDDECEAPPAPPPTYPDATCRENGGTYDEDSQVCTYPVADGGAPADAAASD